MMYLAKRMRQLGLIFAIVCTCGLLSSGSASAIGLFEPFDIYVNTGNQSHPATAYGVGSYLTVWQDDNNPTEVRGRFVLDVWPPDAGLHDTFRISFSPFAPIEDPCLAFNPSKNVFLVVWEQHEWNGQYRLMGARVNTLGQVLGFPFQINQGGICDDPSVAYNSRNGTWLVVWNDFPNGGIKARIVKADGTLSGVQFQVAFGSTDEPSLAYDSRNNEFLVAYRSNNLIRGQRVKGAGGLTGPVLGIDFFFPGSTLGGPSVAYASSTNKYLVTWTTGSQWDSRITGRLVTGGTGFMTPEFRIDSAATLQPVLPSVAFNKVKDCFLVTWEDAASWFWFSSQNIYGQQVSAGGSLQGPNFVVAGRPADQSSPNEIHRNVACGSVGVCLATWEDYFPSWGLNSDIAGCYVW